MRNISSIIFILFLILNPVKPQKPFIKPIYWLRSTQNISFTYYAYEYLYIIYDLTSFKKADENKDELIYFYIKTSDIIFESSEDIQYRISNKPCEQFGDYADYYHIDFIRFDWENAKIVFRNVPIEKPYKLKHYIIGIDPKYIDKKRKTLIIQFKIFPQKGNLLIYRTENPLKEKDKNNKTQEDNLKQ